MKENKNTSAKTEVKETKTEVKETKTEVKETFSVSLTKPEFKSGPKTLASYLGIKIPHEMRGTKQELQARIDRTLTEASNRLQKLGKQALPKVPDESECFYAEAGLFRTGYRPLAYSPIVKGVACLLGQPVTMIVIPDLSENENPEEFEA